MLIKSIHIEHFKGLEEVDVVDCSRVNAFIGRNNSGKSSILHALDMVGLALNGSWELFPMKVSIRDMLWHKQDLSIRIDYDDGTTLRISSTQADAQPRFEPSPTQSQRFVSMFIIPDSGVSLVRREHRTPADVMTYLSQRNYTYINALDILYAVKFYSERSLRGFSLRNYQSLIRAIKEFFPELEDVVADRTESDQATLTYTEYGRDLDIVYAGSGLRYFLDVLIKTEVSQAKVLLIDEPESGLHPSLQRRFAEYLISLARERDLQVFVATHSHIFLNYADDISFYRVLNTKGSRRVVPVPADLRHSLLGDMGILPSDLLHADICLMVEGKADVIFFDYVINTLYKTDFTGVSVAVVQYGGDAAAGIVKGDIRIQNLVPVQNYVYWIHDRDSRPDEPPAENATRFINAVCKHGFKGHILHRREIDFYLPRNLLVVAQQGDQQKVTGIVSVLEGDQSRKFREAAAGFGGCVPQGTYLKRLLPQYLTKDNLTQEIKDLVSELLAWKKELMGETENQSRPAPCTNPSLLRPAS